MNLKRYYSITLTDTTNVKSHTVLSYEEDCDGKRPELQHVLDWIAEQDTAVLKTADEIRQSNSTRGITLLLSARLPITISDGICNHVAINEINMDGLAVEHLKDQYTQHYLKK